MNKDLFANFRGDLAAGLVVFLVALPLCLGIALASGAPLFAGIVSGVVGGVVVGFLSNSGISVTGPAAGLTAIIFSAVMTLGSFEAFLASVIIAGFIQVVLGLLKSGTLSNYLPTSVIEGMLAAIGIIIIMKQIPHAFGYDIDAEGDFSFVEKPGRTAIDTLLESLDFVHPGALVIAVVSILILILWEKIPMLKKLKVLPGALIVVVLSILMNEFFIASGSPLAILAENHLVSLPDFEEIKNGFSLPDWQAFGNPAVWTIALTIAAVASIETLLCIEATDKLDPLKRFTDNNRELRAQGIGNIVSGFLGGLPMTSVVVRSSANVNAGGRTKISAIVHGLLLLGCVLLIPSLLNKIPLSALAAVLIMVGYKLAKPSVFVHLFNNGMARFVPFVITVLGVVFIDLLKGVGIGLGISILFLLYENLKIPYTLVREKNQDNDTVLVLRLAQEVSFLNMAAIKKTLSKIPRGSKLIIDATHTNYIDFDVLEIIHDFRNATAEAKEIELSLAGFKDKYKIEDLNSEEKVEQ